MVAAGSDPRYKQALKSTQATVRTAAQADREEVKQLTSSRGVNVANKAVSRDALKAAPQRRTEIKALPYDKPTQAQVMLLTCLKALLPFGGRLSKPVGLCVQRCSQGEATLGSRCSQPSPRGHALKPPVRADEVQVGQDLGLLHFFLYAFFF